MKPSDLDLAVPGDSWRPGQWDAASRIALSPKRYVLLEGPPGSGKSIIARAAARLLDTRRTHFLTGTIQLQEQYERDGVTRAVGRPNFECAIEPVGADAAICTVGGSCVHAGRRGLEGCDYFDQKREAEAAREAVFNYPYWLRQVNLAGFAPPDFLVADEAHTLKDQVRSFAEVNVIRSSLSRLGLQLPADPDDWSQWRTWARAYYPYVNKQWGELEKEPPVEGQPEKIRYHHSVHSLWQSLRVIRSADDDWIIQSNPYGWSFKSVWVHNLVPKLALQHATQKVLLMSATILNQEVFSQLNGLPPDDTEFIRLPSYFDIKRRPVHYVPVERSGRGGDQHPLLEAVRAILSAHPSDRILVHSVSNWLAAEVAEGLRRTDTRPILSHGPRDRLAVLQRYRDTPGSVLISPSMHTGVDLPDDLLRVQAILRLPFPDMGDPLVKAQMKNATKDNPLDKGQRAYTYDTAAGLIQTYGRIMRSEADYGTTYLLDPAWRWFRHAARDFLPQYFTGAITSEPRDGVRVPVPTTNPDRFLDELLTPRR